MKKKLNLLALLFVISLLNSCNHSISSDDLLGRWEAISVFEEGKALEIDYPVIRLFVSEDGTYNYTGTLNYKESGHWHIQNEYFITKDTLLPDAFERTVLISNLTQDSFEMKMQEGGKERVLVMIKSDI